MAAKLFQFISREEPSNPSRTNGFFKLTARLSEKLYCKWVIMLVTMVTPISSHVKDKVSLLHAVKMCFFSKRRNPYISSVSIQ